MILRSDSARLASSWPPEGGGSDVSHVPVELQPSTTHIKPVSKTAGKIHIAYFMITSSLEANWSNVSQPRQGEGQEQHRSSVPRPDPAWVLRYPQQAFSCPLGSLASLPLPF